MGEDGPGSRLERTVIEWSLAQIREKLSHHAGNLLPFTRKLARRIFPIFFFDHSYILASDLLDIERLNNSTDFVNSYGVVLAWVRTFR